MIRVNLGIASVSYKAYIGRQGRDGQVRFILFRFADNGEALIDVLRIFHFVKYRNGEVGITYITLAF